MSLTLDVIRARLAGREPRRTNRSGMAEAAVAAILAPGTREPGWALLMIRRAERQDDPWSGQMALPGGRRNPADTDLLVTAIRETGEETGVILTRGGCLGGLDDVEPSTPRLPPIVIRPFVFALDRVPAVTISDEVASHVWVPLAGLSSRATEEEIVVRGERRRVRGYRVGDALVWGLTERILTPFLSLVLPAPSP
jgi:8-oxo-dGTP pyrophosphatase MutT (NUDIX family)